MKTLTHHLVSELVETPPGYYATSLEMLNWEDGRVSFAKSIAECSDDMQDLVLPLMGRQNELRFLISNSSRWGVK